AATPSATRPCGRDRSRNMTKTFTRITRRQLLRSLGVATAAAPLIPALDGWAAPAPPKRLLLVFSSNGMVPDLFWPRGTEGDFAFVPGSSLEPLEAHKQDIVVVRSLQRKVQQLGGAHERAMGALWT